jgi:hypothetical protein
MSAGETVTFEGDQLSFHTPRWTRFRSVVFVVVIGGGCFLIAAAVGIAAFAVTWQAGGHWLLAVALAMAVWAFMIPVAWKIAVAPLRFCVTLGGDGVAVGRGWLERRFPYREVDFISLPDEKGRFGIAIESAASGAFAYLAQRDEALCVSLLRKRCANAIFVDRGGREHLPEGCDHPLRALGLLYRRCRALARGSLFSSLFAGFFSILSGFGLCCRLLGPGPNPAAADLLRASCWFTGSTIAAGVGARYALVKWRQARAIRAELSTFPLPDDSPGAEP